MADVKQLNTPLHELQQAGERWAEARAQLDAATAARDAAILAATVAGASRRQVAAVAGVTVGRVQQIVGMAD